MVGKNRRCSFLVNKYGSYGTFDELMAGTCVKTERQSGKNNFKWWDISKKEKRQTKRKVGVCGTKDSQKIGVSNWEERTINKIEWRTIVQ